MKKTFFSSLFTLIAVCTFAQDIDQKNVPAVVLNAFQLKFANARDINWELEKGNYQVDFELNDKDHKVWLDDKGTLLKHEQDLWESEVPASVISTIKSKCEFFDLHDAERTAEGGKIVYYISFERNKKDCEFWIDEKGKLIKFRKELQTSEIPAPILSSIQSQYPSFDLDAAVRNEDGGEVHIYLKADINDKEHLFWYDGNGKLLKHNQDLRNSEIPIPVMNSISALYAGYEINDADKITQGGDIIYEIELKKSKERMDILFNEKGEVVKSTSR